MTIKGLCKYYISCLALESNTSFRASMKDKQSYLSIPQIDNSVLRRSEVGAFLNGSHEKEKELLIGYPILKDKHFLSPIFIIHITYNDGAHGGPEGFTIDDELLINKDIIDRYSTNEKTENIYELRDLESALGLSDGHTEVGNLTEKANLLKSIRPGWDWLEDMDASHLQNNPLLISDADGIRNRAILFSKDPTPYTVGLSNELARLAECGEHTIRHSILWKMIHNQFEEHAPYDKDVLEVLPLNSEQERAVRSALSADVTLISGPPGTGKSQVVANLIINAAIAGQNVLFTSKNNNAVDVVVKRVNALNEELPLILRYEKSAKQSISDYALKWENASKIDNPSRVAFDEYRKIHARYHSKQEQRKQIVEKRNKLDNVEQSICSIRERYKPFIGVVKEQEVVEAKKAYNSFVNSRNVLLNGPQHLFDKIFKRRWRRRIAGSCEASAQVLNAIAEKYHSGQTIAPEMSERDWVQFDNGFKTLINDIELIANYNSLLAQVCNATSLEQLDAALLADHVELQSKAKEAWNAWLNDHIDVFKEKNRGLLHDYLVYLEQGYVDIYTPSLKVMLPVSAITSLSARRRIPFKEAVYDLLIIDEASQCDIASMIPLLMRAKRVAVIGDQKQLNHICLLNKQTDMSLLMSNEIVPRWSYRSCSIYDLAQSVSEGKNIVQLRDHHRSFLDIIQFSNQEFYSNTLRIATDYSRLKSPNNGTPILGMQWMDLKGVTIRPETGGAYNLKEAEGVLRILHRLAIELGFKGSIGITTPFHLQAEMIKAALERDSELRNHLELHNQILIDTVHKFQGDERDVIIFSPVVSTGTQPQSLVFLKSTGNLFNVAITRARSLLVTVGDKEYCKHCGVGYLEHFSEYNVGKDAPVEASEWEHQLQKALSDAGIPVTAQYHADKYYLDLALFYKGQKLDIEVDGAMYHQSWTGELSYKDQLRNQTLMSQGWDVIRFWVQQVRDQMPWCINQVKNWMDMVDQRTVF